MRAAGGCGREKITRSRDRTAPPWHARRAISRCHHPPTFGARTLSMSAASKKSHLPTPVLTASTTPELPPRPVRKRKRACSDVGAGETPPSKALKPTTTKTTFQQSFTGTVRPLTTPTIRPQTPSASPPAEETSPTRFSPVRPILAPYDPTFGAKVCRAYHLKQQAEHLLHYWRQQRYGPTIADTYSRGSTPEPIRVQCEREEQEKVCAYEAELGETDDED